MWGILFVASIVGWPRSSSEEDYFGIDSDREGIWGD